MKSSSLSFLRPLSLSFLLSLSLSFLLSLSVSTSLSAAEKPNVIVSMTDDLGYGDIGAFRAKGYAPPISTASPRPSHAPR